MRMRILPRANTQHVLRVVKSRANGRQLNVREPRRRDLYILFFCTRLIDCRLLFSVKSCLSHQSKIRPHVQFSLEYSSSLSNQSSIPKFLNLSPPSFLKPGLSPSSQSNLRSQAFSRQNSGNIYSDFIPPWKRSTPAAWLYRFV